jgi:hypothetical protein
MKIGVLKRTKADLVAFILQEGPETCKVRLLDAFDSSHTFNHPTDKIILSKRSSHQVLPEFDFDPKAWATQRAEWVPGEKKKKKTKKKKKKE